MKYSFYEFNKSAAIIKAELQSEIDILRFILNNFDSSFYKLVKLDDTRIEVSWDEDCKCSCLSDFLDRIRLMFANIAWEVEREFVRVRGEEMDAERKTREGK